MKRPSVVFRGFTFISGDSYLVVQKGENLVDMCEWGKTRREIVTTSGTTRLQRAKARPTTVEELKECAEEWWRRERE